MTSFDMTELTHNLPSTSSSPSPWRSNTNTPAPYVMAPDRVTAPQPRTMDEFITQYADWQWAYATNKILAGLPPAMPLNVQQPSYTSPRSPPWSSISSLVMYWAWPGLKALAWAWLTRARAYSNLRPGPDGGLRLGLGLAQAQARASCQNCTKVCIVIVGNIWCNFWS